MALYERHKSASVPGLGTYDDFCAVLIDHAQGPCHFLFNVLPLCPSASEAFYTKLAPEERQFMSGLVNLTQIPHDAVPFAVDTEITPNIFLESIKKDDFLAIGGDFDLIAVAEKAAIVLYEHGTLAELQALSEEQQLAFLGFLEQWGSFDPRANEEAHKKLVFALHIPEEIKTYHRACIEELSRRIIINPVYARLFDAFLTEGECSDTDAPLMKSREDRKFMVNFFMREMADIWGIPQPAEEDYNEEEKADRQGRLFQSAMHAFLRESPDGHDVKPLGLIFGINNACDDGYLTHHDIHTLGLLAHEFGHLFVIFLLCHYHGFFKESPFLNSQILQLSHLSNVMKYNDDYGSFGRYYSPLKTDFGALVSSNGRHPYSGQVNERHSDWLGEEVMKAIVKAIQMRPLVRNLDWAKRRFTGGLYLIASYTKHEAANGEWMARFESVKSFDELLQCAAFVCDALESWAGENPATLDDDKIINFNVEGDCRQTPKEALVDSITRMRSLSSDISRYRKYLHSVLLPPALPASTSSVSPVFLNKL